MKTLKERFLRKNLGLGKEVLIKNWLDEHKITNYTINKDLTIDVDGTVDLSYSEEEQLPDYIQFGKVTKNFYIYGCPKLESLGGCPKEVGWSFSCHGCPKLESLEGCPQKVGGDFYCIYCSKLESLEGCPKEVGWGFSCYGCPGLESLEGCPKKVGGDFHCKNCGIKFTLNEVNKYCNVKGKIMV